MNESILNSLIHLFAIINNVDDDDFSSNSRDIVKSYLNKHLSKKLADEYIILFDNYFDFHHKDIFNSKENLQENNYEYLENVCRQINKELNRKERMYVFLQLCEFINIDFTTTNPDTEILKIVANNFNLTDEEYNDITVFIFDKEAKKLNPEKTLIIENKELSEDSEGTWFGWKKNVENSKSKNIFSKNLKGKIVVLHIYSINMYVFRYFGNEDLNIDGIAIIENVFYVLNPNSAISGKFLNPIYYSEIKNKFSSFYNKYKVFFKAENIENNSKKSANNLRVKEISGQSGELIGIISADDYANYLLSDILSGNRKANAGKILINNVDLHKNKFKFDGIIGHVQKNSIIIENLTVYENLYYNAKLYFNDYTETEIQEVVENIITENNLQNVRNSLIKNSDFELISKLQIKKINIALELIRRPAILFVDGPTCGLSSNDSDIIMHYLKEQANQNTLIFASIENCSSAVFKLFDKICLIDKGGYQIFFGKPKDAIVYFRKTHTHLHISESECPSCGNINHHQIFQIIETKIVDEFGKYTNDRKISAKEWYQNFLNYNNGKNNSRKKDTDELSDIALPIRHFNTVNSFKQFKIFFKSNLQSLFVNKKYLAFVLVISPILAVLLSLILKTYTGEKYIFIENSNLPNYIIFSVISSLFFGFSISINVLGKDRYIIQHYDFINLNKYSYYNSKIIILLLISFVQILIYVSLGNFFLEIKNMNFIYFIVLFATSSFAVMFGLLLSQTFLSKRVLYIIIPVVLLFQFIFSGAFIKFDSFHKIFRHEEYVPLIADFSVARWAFEALAVEQFIRNDYEKYFFDLDKDIISANNKQKIIIPKLISLLDECDKYFEAQFDIKKIEKNLKILQNEIPHLWKDVNRKPFEFINRLNLKDFNHEVSNSCSNYLEFLKWHNKSMKKRKSIEYNKLYYSLINTLGMYEVNRLRNGNYNNELADLLTNKSEDVSIIEINNRLILKKDPIYTDAKCKFGRAHLFSANKLIVENYYDTFVFNLLIIIFFTMFLYLILLSEIIIRIRNRFVHRLYSIK